MDDERLKKAIDLAKEATQKDEAKEYQLAFNLYRQSLEHWFLVIKYQKNPALKRRLQQKMEEYTSRAEAIKVYLDKSKEAKRRAPVVVDSAEHDLTKSDPEADDKSKLKNALSGIVVTTKPDVTWDQVAGLEQAKSALREAVVLPLRFPKLFTGKRKPWRGILLYGPPGTGKTFLAKACAAETSSTFLSASSADLMSKWQGESEKLVRILFETARDRRPSVIFIDEIDSIGGARSDHESESSRRVKTEFLVQMDGLGNDINDVLVLGATNVPWDLDTAIRRRFERRVYISLPDLAARRRMLELAIASVKHNLTPQNITMLANKLEGFSGSDIAILCRDALLQGVRKLSTATHFKHPPGDSSKWTPCAPDDVDPSKQDMRLMDISNSELEPPDLSLRDFIDTISNARASVGAEDIDRYRQWTDKFGLDGS